jgi:cytochrome c2
MLSTPQGHTQAESGSSHGKQMSPPAVAQYTTDEEEGARVFAQNCARCHRSPDGFSSRISGTIVRHMRVRANLSQHDEQVLLRYFNQ